MPLSKEQKGFLKLLFLLVIRPFDNFIKLLINQAK